MKNATTLLGVSILTLSLFTSIAHAQGTVGVTNVIDGSTSAAVGAAIDTSIKTDVSAKSDTETGVGVTVKSTARTGTSSNSSGTASSTAQGNSDASLKVNASGIAVMSSTQVDSQADLEVFSSNVSAKNKAVARVEIRSENTEDAKVEVVYKHKGRFLWFIPVTITSTTVVQARDNGEADVNSRLSWWSFLVAGEDYDKATLESSIRNSATVRANASVDASAQAKARIAEAVITELQANAAAQVSANIR